MEFVPKSARDAISTMHLVQANKETSDQAKKDKSNQNSKTSGIGLHASSFLTINKVMSDNLPVSVPSDLQSFAGEIFRSDSDRMNSLMKVLNARKIKD